LLNELLSRLLRLLQFWEHQKHDKLFLRHRRISAFAFLNGLEFLEVLVECLLQSF